MTDLAKAQNVVGREVAAIKIEDKEIWLDFRDGSRMVLVDNEIVHQFRLFQLDCNMLR